MKTLLILSGVMAVAMAKAGTVTLDLTPNYDWWGGGEFTAYTSDSFVGNYAPSATYDGGFETFCLETGVEFYPGSSYTYSLGNVTQPVPASGVGSDLYLTAGAAYLYSQFAQGILSGFDYDTPGDFAAGTDAGRVTDDHLLQAAIWALQGGQTYGNYPSLSDTELDNPFYSAALAHGGTAQYTGTTVQVLQMWDGSDAVQNQLVYTPSPAPNFNPSPVPDGGSTVALLGMTFAGMGWLRRKL
jgi:hypothetical protein